MKTNFILFISVISSLLISCNQIETKTEKLITDEVKGQLLNKNLCDGVSVVDVNFDNNPDDNSGANFNLSGTATLTNGVERQVNLEGDISENDNWTITFGDETQESMKNRFLQLLNSGSFSSFSPGRSVPSDITFESDNTGYYHSDDGDRYSFEYSISNIYHGNEFPQINSKDSKCDDFIESVTLDRQSFEGSFNMSNNRFVLNGTIKINGPDMRVEIIGEVEDNETSRSENIEWTLYKD